MELPSLLAENIVQGFIIGLLVAWLFAWRPRPSETY